MPDTGDMAIYSDRPRLVLADKLPAPPSADDERLIAERAAWWRERLDQRTRAGAAHREHRSRGVYELHGHGPGTPPSGSPPAAA